MENTAIQKVSLRSIGIVGATIFGIFFTITYSIPGWVEDFGSDYIEAEAEKRIDYTIDGIKLPASENAVARFAQSLYKKNETQITQLRSKLKAEIHQQWATALALVRNLDCECRDKYARMFEDGFNTDINLIQAANDQLVDFIQYKYMDVTNELKRDIRAFTASNAAAFVLLLLISFLKPRAITHLFLPGLLIAASTIVCSYFYIFEQNWLLTIIHSSYLGLAYLGWLGFVFLFFCDIVINRARITAHILNWFLNAIGSATSIVPC